MNQGNAKLRQRSAQLAVWCALCSIFVIPGQTTGNEIEPFALPPLTQTTQEAWLNSPPLASADLAGKVVLVDFWTFDCWNCYRSFPWLTRLEKRLDGDEVIILGIHSPEFTHEQERGKVAAKMKAFALAHPVMLDNDFRFWNAMDNRAWPAFYLVDRSGRVRYRFYGETHEGDAQARAIEAAIERLLTEPGSDS